MESVVPTTTATTESPPSIADAVRRRILHLHDRGVRTLTLADFQGTAKCTGRPESWVADHLLVLEGIGVLRPARRGGTRAWTVSAGSEYLR
jgi:hypothetical protein